MALLPEIFVKSTVAIYGENIHKHKVLLGSGFIYGRFFKKETEETEQYMFYLITCRHVIEKESNIYLKFSSQENPEVNLKIRKYKGEFELSKINYWYEHPTKDLDIAVVTLNFKEIEKFSDWEFIRNNQNTAPIKKMMELGVSEGDFIYVIGFPELTLDKKDKLIARNGTIAHISSLYGGNNDDFVIDAFIFPGNSGGPVILKPESLALAGTKPYQHSYILGMVSDYYSYPEEALLRTNERRVLFEDNSGLGSVYPIDLIEEIIDYHNETVKNLMKNLIITIETLSNQSNIQEYTLNNLITSYRDYVEDITKNNLPDAIIKKLLKVYEEEDTIALINSINRENFTQKIEEYKRIFNSTFVDFYMSEEEVKENLKRITKIEDSFNL